MKKVNCEGSEFGSHDVRLNGSISERLKVQFIKRKFTTLLIKSRPTPGPKSRLFVMCELPEQVPAYARYFP